MTKTILTSVFGSLLIGPMLFNSPLIGQETKPSDKPIATEAAAIPETKKKIDQTGINWVLSFSAAMEKAKTENRLIAIKMIAFGTNQSGCW